MDFEDNTSTCTHMYMVVFSQVNECSQVRQKRSPSKFEMLWSNRDIGIDIGLCHRFPKKKLIKKRKRKQCKKYFKKMEMIVFIVVRDLLSQSQSVLVTLPEIDADMAIRALYLQTKHQTHYNNSCVSNTHGMEHTEHIGSLAAIISGWKIYCAILYCAEYANNMIFHYIQLVLQFNQLICYVCVCAGFFHLHSSWTMDILR